MKKGYLIGLPLQTNQAAESSTSGLPSPPAYSALQLWRNRRDAQKCFKTCSQ